MTAASRHRMVAVIGNGDADPERDALAEALGRAVAGAGYGIVCGGLGGVMAAACRGAASVENRRAPVVGLLPGSDAGAANPWVDVVLPTGLGYARNLLVTLAADAVVAVGGASGTLSEIAHAWQLGRPVCALQAAGGWAAELAGRTLDGKRRDRVEPADTVEEVMEWLASVLAGSPSPTLP